jgi:FlaA1/EpsC-like NDP-sugar epimerase
MTDGASQPRAGRSLAIGLSILFDVVVVVAATFIAYVVRFDSIAVPAPFAAWALPLAAAATMLYVVLFALFGLYRLVLRYAGVDVLLKLSAATGIGFAVLLGGDFALHAGQVLRPVPIGVLFIQAVLVFLGGAAERLAVRVGLYLRAARGDSGRRVLVVGAGSAGSLLLREIQNRPDLDLHVVGFLDDDPSLRGRTIGGVPVLGPTDMLGEMVERLRVEETLVAMPAAPREMVRGILNAAADAGVQTRIMPELVIAKGSVSLRDLRGVDVEDLLGREPARIDVQQVRETLADKVVAVTGAAGSIGSELCRQIIGMGPKRLVLIEIDETRLYELWLELETMAPGVSVMCLCDIRDASTLDATFDRYRPQIVLHAAAYKHVPLMELAPDEAVKTNVLGTLQVVEACERAKVERFVLISTDKAVAPVNVMGLTKSLAERVMLQGAQRGLHAVAVRFGNVLASRGSVVPIFEEQLRRGGPLTVTDKDVTRYFMTIPEAARLVLQAQAIGEAGDIFVLEMGDPVRIVDLARKMIALSGVPADIDYVGLRPGEKLHESLVSESESLVSTEREKILRVDRVPVLPETFAADIGDLVHQAMAGRRDAMDAVIARLEPGFADRDRPKGSAA